MQNKPVFGSVVKHLDFLVTFHYNKKKTNGSEGVGLATESEHSNSEKNYQKRDTIE